MVSTTPDPDPAFTLDRLRRASSLHDIASLLGFAPKALSYLLYRLRPADRYNSFEIPKKSGGMRKIHAPREELGLLQRRLADRLLECIKAIEAERGERNNCAHGFVPGRNTYSNAATHRKQLYVFNVDIQDFFGAIHFGRVRGYFIKNSDFKLNPAAATVLAQIACHDPDAQGAQSGRNSHLPQGSPCSPVLSNLIGGLLDRQLVSLAARHGCRYSRYADDLTFSTSKPTFPKEIARKNADSWEAGPELERALANARFALNPKKTRMQYHWSRQEVTGLVVNRIANTRPEYRQKVRAMVRSLVLTGEYSPRPDAVKTSDLQILAGMLGYISHIDRVRRVSYGEPVSTNEDYLTSREKTYKRFLLFRHFYASEIPIIVCEGKTDAVYLKFAFQALMREFPHFFERDGEGKAKRIIRLFDHSERYTSRLVGFNSGGAGEIKGFIQTYIRESTYFRAPAKGPVLVLVDRDSGFKHIFPAVAALMKPVKPEQHWPFFPVGKSLYVIPTPLPSDAKESEIEDFFPIEVKQEVIGGKVLHTNNATFDPSQHYSKHVFAMEVIRKKHAEIDFTGFRPLMKLFSEVLAYHSNSVATSHGGT